MACHRRLCSFHLNLLNVIWLQARSSGFSLAGDRGAFSVGSREQGRPSYRIPSSPTDGAGVVRPRGLWHAGQTPGLKLPRGGGWRASRGPWAGVPGPPWGAPEFPPPQPGSRPLCAASALGARGASVPRWRSARSPGAASARGRVGADAAPTAREGGRGDGTSGTLHVSDGLVRGRPPWAAPLPPPPSLADGPGPRREACPTGRSRQLICFHTWKLLRKPQN